MRIRTSICVFLCELALSLAAGFAGEANPPARVARTSSNIIIASDTTRFTLRDTGGSFRLISVEHVPTGTKFMESALPGEAVWRVVLRDAAKNLHTVEPGPEGLRSLEEETSQNAKLYKLNWKRLPIENEPGVLDVTVSVKVPNDSPLTYWRISVTNRSKMYALWNIEFPRLPSLGPLDEPEDDIFIDPVIQGHRTLNPYEILAPRYYAMYPGYASFQMCAFYDEKLAGLYFASYDANGYYKHFNYGPTSDKKHVELYLTNFPEGQGVIVTNYEMPYDVVVGAFTGDWWTAAKMYRDWAIKQVWCSKGKLAERKDIPNWFKELPLWEIVAADKYDSMVYFRQAMGIDYADHWPYLWKHPGQGDRMSPDLFPPLGGEQAFREGVKKAHEAGVKLVPYLLGSCLDREAPQYKEWGVEPYVIWDESGTPFALQIPPWEQLSLPATSLPWPCPFPDFWPEKVAELSRRVMELGVDGIYYDTTSGNCWQCFNPNHGHPVGGGNYWFLGNRKLFKRCREEIRKVNPEGIMTSEEPNEAYIDQVDGFLIYCDHGPNHIPAFQAIYHDYVFLYGQMLATERVPNQDYPVTLPIGISFINGDQLGWFAIWHILIKPENERDLKFLRKLAHFRKKCAGKFLGTGELVRPPEFEAALPTVRGAWGYVPVERPVERLAVLLSAWKADDGSLGLVFLNISTEPQDVSLDFRPADYGFAAGEEIVSYSLALDASENLTRTQGEVFSGETVRVTKRFEPLEVWALEFVGSLPLRTGPTR